MSPTSPPRPRGSLLLWQMETRSRQHLLTWIQRHHRALLLMVKRPKTRQRTWCHRYRPRCVPAWYMTVNCGLSSFGEVIGDILRWYHAWYLGVLICYTLSIVKAVRVPCVVNVTRVVLPIVLGHTFVAFLFCHWNACGCNRSAALVRFLALFFRTRACHVIKEHSP